MTSSGRRRRDEDLRGRDGSICCIQTAGITGRALRRRSMRLRGAEDLLQIVNSSSENAKRSDCHLSYEALEMTLATLYGEYA